MKILSKDCFSKASQSIMKQGRPLEKSLWQYYFVEGSNQAVINELKKFQNEDGGFGHGIESDFRMPYSSPMAASVGVRILSEINSFEESKEMIRAAVGYLEASFDRERSRWFVASKEINNFPHAPWWNYNREEGMTIIDRNWGNPSAEIVAYLYKYRDHVNKLDVDSLVEYAVDYIENKHEFSSESELFCYIRLYKVLPQELQRRLEKTISMAIGQVIVYDEKRWHEYVPRPIDFIDSPVSCRFGVMESKINDNLDFIINELELREKISPPWGESFYKDDMKEAYNEWIGVLTLKALVALDKYNRIEK